MGCRLMIRARALDIFECGIHESLNHCAVTSVAPQHVNRMVLPQVVDQASNRG
jgi:hypothetical protein